ETTNINKRTQQHLLIDPKIREDWKALSEAKNSSMYIIGHKYFNKSLTLDIENRLMLYLSSIENVKSVYNRRTNEQNKYYTSNKLDEVFSEIWLKLRNKNKKLFPMESVIKDSALFKASPFHKLTNEQLEAKMEILNTVAEILQNNTTGNLIIVNGAAGSGKTVLLSSLFYDLFNDTEFQLEKLEKTALNNYLLVNHEQLLVVYEQIASKLNILGKNVKRVLKPTKFINRNSEENKADIVLIDEAHLLWTQGKQSYRGKNQLIDIINRSKLTIAVFDEDQIMQTNQYMEKDIHHLVPKTKLHKITLKNQMRINASLKTIEWIENFARHNKIGTINKDDSYDLRVFDSPEDLVQAIKERNFDSNKGISRTIASFDWEYSSNKKPENTDFWMVKIGTCEMPWNLQLQEYDIALKKQNKNRSWAEQPHTINEVGSHYTVQGFDLNYAGVIIGPSVKYRNGKVIIDPNESKNKHATQRRTFSNNEKRHVSEELIQNELNVLLTRGVNGLYIYAVDEQLRNKLLEVYRNRGE
ncbi:TPA: DNA/RNA helicase domain-containing protein, partial [Streptococcus suis]